MAEARRCASASSRREDGNAKRDDQKPFFIRQCCPSLVRILRAAMARESDPTAMLGLVILVIVAELLAIAVGVTFGMFIG